jgi:peptidoglycan/xylan/chitin deacetylase (PgdA/CDA1 family)
MSVTRPARDTAVRVIGRLSRVLLSRRCAAMRTVAVPVLTYHSIADDAWGALSRYRISRRAFRRQMAFLRAAGFAVLPLETLVTRLDDCSEPVPAKAVALTFDDGYEDFYAAALPVLRRHAFPATVFLVTDLMGAPAAWLGPGVSTPLMTWSQALAATRQGIGFSSHSATHPHLSSAPTTSLAREVAHSRRMIEDRLGADAPLFCYPHGDFDDRVRSAVRDAGYTAAFSTEVGLMTPGQHRHALRRVKVRPNDSMLDLAAKLFTGHDARTVWWRTVRRDMR